MSRERLAVIGNGMAGIRAVEDVMERAPGRYDIAVFGAEPHPAYNRIMLSPVLAGEKDFAAIVTHDRDWYERNGIALHTGARVTAVHPDERIIVTSDDNSFAYDKLVLATGSDAFILPVEGANLPGVIGFRTADDVEIMLRAARTSGSAVVIGGGLLGIEAACALRQRGMKVSLLHVMPHLMERQLDAEAASLLRREIEKRGIEVVCSAVTEKIAGKDHARGVVLNDGRTLAADLVVMAVGIRPNIGPAREAGLCVVRGIVVDAHMRTSDPHVYAVGECAEHAGVCLGLVAPIYDMTKALAATLAGENRPYIPAPVSTRLKVSGVDVFSAGDFSSGEEREDIILRDPAHAVYRRLIVREDRLVGAVLYGDTYDSAFFSDLILSSTDISPVRDVLIFGRALCEAA